MIEREVEVGSLLGVRVVFVSNFLNLLLELLRNFELPIAHLVDLKARPVWAAIAPFFHNLHVRVKSYDLPAVSFLYVQRLKI